MTNISPVVSVITAVFNRQDTIEDALRSVRDQSYAHVEHVVIDGNSTDGTLDLLERCRTPEMRIISEPDKGIYDALNKGLRQSTGEIVGLMHSDDYFASDRVLQLVVNAFTDPTVDAVYGDLQYVSAHDPARVIRHWTAGTFSTGKLARGWMPPHPTLYLRRRVFEHWGTYDTNYRIAADYDVILRYFGIAKVKAAYIPEVFVKMRLGGESNRSFQKMIQKSLEDYRALRDNKIGGLGALALKNASKIGQFLIR